MTHISSSECSTRLSQSPKWLWLVVAFTGLVACDGSDDSPQAQSLEPAPVPTTVMTEVSGKATYARVPHDPITNGLSYPFTYSAPIRGAVVELIGQDGSTIDTTVTSEDGVYRFNVPVGQNVTIRVKARLLSDRTPSWDIKVVDNTRGDALYALATTPFITDGKKMTRDIAAASGWNGSEYADERAAAPFAILDTVYTAVADVVATGDQRDFPPLELNWSTENRPTSGALADGEIGSSLFRPFAGGREIYILGAANVDTDEYDEHVIAHEFTHYLHFHFGRTDSPGGSHSMSDRLDPRVAFSEGLASAFAAMFLDDAIYIDSLGFDQRGGVSTNLENNLVRNAGWYNQESVQILLYDLFDEALDDADTVQLTFADIYGALTGQLRSAVPLVTIHSFMDAMKNQVPAIASDIDAMALSQGIHTSGSDAYGSGETNSAARYDKVLPIYTELPVDGRSVNVCTIAGIQGFGTMNKLGNRRFLRFSITDPLPNTATIITATGPEGSDPDLILHRVGKVQSSLTDFEGPERLRRIFTEGSYVLEVYEYSNTTDQPLGNVCFDLSMATE